MRIVTSKPGWLGELAEAYRKRDEVILVDDAHVGIDPETQSLFEMGRHVRLRPREWAGVLTALGMSGVGIWMIAAALRDPEPTSRLWLLAGGGTVLVFGGGFSAIRILTRELPPDVEVTAEGFRLKWR